MATNEPAQTILMKGLYSPFDPAGLSAGSGCRSVKQSARERFLEGAHRMRQ